MDVTASPTRLGPQRRRRCSGAFLPRALAASSMTSAARAVRADAARTTTSCWRAMPRPRCEKRVAWPASAPAGVAARGRLSHRHGPVPQHRARHPGVRSPGRRHTAVDAPRGGLHAPDGGLRARAAAATGLWPCDAGRAAAAGALMRPSHNRRRWRTRERVCARRLRTPTGAVSRLRCRMASVRPERPGGARGPAGAASSPRRWTCGERSAHL